MPKTKVIKIRVAREGQTVDGRTLSAEHIVEMADSYDMQEYTARINCDHVNGWGLESRFPSFGDVTAVEAIEEEFTIGGVTKTLMCLYNTIAALPNMVESVKAGQKLYPSIEFYPKFADTDKAYQVGLAMTDTPASRGTEPFKFSSQALKTSITQPDKEIFIMPKDQLSDDSAENPTQQSQQSNPQEQQNLSAGSAGDDTGNDNPADKPKDGFVAKMKAMFSAKPVGLTDEQSQVILGGFEKIGEQIEDLTNTVASLSQENQSLSDELDQLKQTLTNTPQGGPDQLNAGDGSGYALTDF